MENIIQPKLKLLNHIIDQICQPNPKIIKNTDDGQSLLRRNKVLLFLHLLAIIMMMVFYKLTTTNKFTLLNSYSSICIFELATFLLLCRSYPLALKIFYFTLVSVVGPYSVYACQEAFPLTWISVHVFPTYVLYVNGLPAYIFQIILQIGYLAFIYKPFVTDLIIHSNPVLFAEQIVNISVAGIVTNVLIISITSSALKKASSEIIIHKMKQNELERQKAFLLGFSHELRNITNSLLGNIQLALLEDLSVKVKCLLNSCQIFGGLLLHLINNALDVGKVEVGELEINPTSTPIYDTLEKIWNICIQLVKNRQLQGYLKVQNKLPRILKIDQYRLMQIITNLVSNATKFTEKGIVSMDVQWIEGADRVLPQYFEPAPYDETDEGLFEKNDSLSILNDDQIFLNLQQTNIDRRKIENNIDITKGVIKIIVKDTGCGIYKEKLPNIFNRANDNADDETVKRLGTRLSLFVTKCLVQRMNGDIRAYSRVGKGTTFILCLPLEVAEENRVKIFPKEEVKKFIETSNLRALLVDDMQFNRMILANYLKSVKITNTTEARNGQEAFEIFKRNVDHETKQSFDVITMDVEMPVLDGKKAVELIRNYEHQYNLKPCLIIMVSGNCSESEISECLNPSKLTGYKNADFFLKKPASIDELSNVITGWYQKTLSLQHL